MKIQINLQRFFEELESHLGSMGKTRDNLTVLFATKYLNAEKFVSFLDIAKQFDIDNLIIGENRVQDWEGKYEWLRQKRPDLVGNFKAVMIGTLQKNKVNKALEIFEEIHSVDSIDLAETIDKRVKKGRKIPIYLEVNVSGEERKHGFKSEELDSSLRKLRLLKSLNVKGLMTMAPNTKDEAVVRNVFRTLRTLADQYNLKTSMGMSHDWKIAVEEGSDMVRIGSRIFQ